MIPSPSIIPDVVADLAEYAKAVDHEIAGALMAEVDDTWMRAAISYHLGWGDTDFAPLAEGARQTGKRLRPGLALLAYRGAATRMLASPAGTCVDPMVDVRAEPCPALPFAAALELVHNFTLVHDDIEDQDRFRRGRPTLWTLCGEARAINVGDCLHALALCCLDRLRGYGVPEALVSELALGLSRTVVDLTIGQSQDLAFEETGNVDQAAYMRMIGGKTAVLLSCALWGGARLALHPTHPATAETLAAFAEFGRQFGLAFQISDDYLGVWGAEEVTGKPTGSDIRRRKKSLPVVFALHEASDPARRSLARLYRLPGELTPQQERAVRVLLESSHADAFTQQQAELHTELAQAALVQAAGGAEALAANPYLSKLEELAKLVSRRSH